MNPGTDQNPTNDLLEEEELSMEGYEKPVKKAGNILYAIAAIQLAGIYTAFQQYGLARVVTLIFSIGIALLFFLLGLYTKRKPDDAIIAAIVYAIITIGVAIAAPTTICGVLFLG